MHGPGDESLGDALGEADGPALGLAESDALGEALGDADGFPLGLLEGVQWVRRKDWPKETQMERDFWWGYHSFRLGVRWVVR